MSEFSRTYGFVVPQGRLSYGLAVRGWTKGDLARIAGVSPGVVSAACAGRRITPRSVDRIAAAFEKNPPVDRLVALMREEAS